MSDVRGALRSELDEAHRGLRSLLDTVTGAEWDRPTPNEGWSVKDTLSHLASGESGNLTIARKILNGEAKVVDGFDLDRYNQRQIEKHRERTPDELWQALEAARADTLTLLDSLTVEQLSLSGHRPTGPETTIEGVFRQIVSHERGHAADIRAGLGR